jgi:hypothetical protein
MKEFETLVGLTKRLVTAVVGSDAQLTVTRIDEGGLDGGASHAL